MLVIRGFGIQTSTSSSTYLSTAATRFIPTTQIQDIVIHEAFKGFEVRFYLAVIVEDEPGVLVVFPVSRPLIILCSGLIDFLVTSNYFQSARSWNKCGEVLDIVYTMQSHDFIRTVEKATRHGPTLSYASNPVWTDLSMYIYFIHPPSFRPLAPWRQSSAASLPATWHFVSPRAPFCSFA